MRAYPYGFAVALLLPPAAGPARAWGQHTEITAAALDVLPGGDDLKKHFGDDWGRLARDYCWTGDWQEAVRPDHYADDYLLFPSFPGRVSHLLPDVRRTYRPFFRRALQAARTESPREAARWAGSLLHFVQDSGSPPHTTGVGGELHGKMERWVDESQIRIAGYRPALLGETDDAALRGFEARTDALVEYARVRSVKLRPLVEKLERRVDQPLELECALETARVTADVLHTLFERGLAGPAAGGVLEGKVNARPPDGYAAVPAKVMLAGTDYSTTAAADGAYRFRNLPPGRYTVVVLATGYEAVRGKEIELTDGKRVRLDLDLRPDAVAGNLVRNPRFEVTWVKEGQPDAWYRDPRKGGRWASAVVRVPVGRACRVRVEFVPGKRAPVAVRWRSNPSSLDGSRETALDAGKADGEGRLVAEVAADPLLRPFEKGVLFLEVLLQTEGAPAEACRHVAVTYGARE